MMTCKGCKDRHPACHDSCEKYQEEKRKNDIAKGRRNKGVVAEIQIMNYYSEKKAKKLRKYKGDVW